MIAHCIKSEVQKGENSAKFQSRVTELVQEGDVMTLDECMKFQCNSRYGF